MNSDSKENSGWVRSLGQFEAFMTLAGREGIMVTCYALTLNSKLPLKESDIREAMLHLFRKLPNLRMSVRPNDDGKLWFHVMEREIIDFQILENADYQEEYDKMTSHIYNTIDGPLWCGRLLPLPEDTPCFMPEIKTDYPNQYYFLFGFHHSITDGTSTVKTCSIFLNLLNDVIAGNEIDDSEQLAEFTSPEETDKLIMEAFIEMQANPSEMQQYQRLLEGSLEDVLFLKVFPPPENAKAKTLNITQSLTTDETLVFLKRCKKEGVTLHSGFCAAVNAAIVRLIENEGFKQDTYQIKHYHTINNRRYWKGDTSRAFGAHLGKLTILSEINNDINEFWNQARTFHATMVSYLQNKVSIKESAAMLFSFPQDLPTDLDIIKLMSEMSLGDTYYGTTNMGNFASTFPGEGEFVQVTDFRRTTSTTRNLCSHVFQTFRGRFIYGIDYEAKFISDESAQRYLDEIFHVIKTVAFT